MPLALPAGGNDSELILQNGVKLYKSLFGGKGKGTFCINLICHRHGMYVHSQKWVGLIVRAQRNKTRMRQICSSTIHVSSAVVDASAILPILSACLATGC